MGAPKRMQSKLLAVLITAGVVSGISSIAAGRSYFNLKYMKPVATRHVDALTSTPLSAKSIDSYMASLIAFNSGEWIKFLSQEQKARLSDTTKKAEEIVRVRDQVRQAKQAEEQAKSAAAAQAEEERRNPDFEARLTNFFVDMGPDTFTDRIAQVRDGVISVSDLKCKLTGETVPGEGGCSVQMSNGRPVSAKWWLDDDEGYHLYSTATFGKQVNRGSYNPEKAANPYIALQQSRLQNMIKDFHKEQESARRNCKGLKGDAWTRCAGAQTAN